MTVEQVPDTNAGRATSTNDILLDGLFTGIIGALVVAIWFLILDLFAGRPLYTPALLGNVLLHGGPQGNEPIVIAPLEVAAYTAFHFIVFILVGIALSYMMTLFEKFPIVGFVLLVVFVCLQLGFFVLDVALGAQLLGRLRTWTVLIANLLAAGSMAWYLWKRHPRVRQSIEHFWDEP